MLFAIPHLRLSFLMAAGNDGAARLFEIPEEGLTSDLNESHARLTLQPSEKRMISVSFHPTAADVVFTQTADKSVPHHPVQ